MSKKSVKLRERTVQISERLLSTDRGSLSSTTEQFYAGMFE